MQGQRAEVGSQRSDGGGENCRGGGGRGIIGSMRTKLLLAAMVLTALLVSGGAGAKTVEDPKAGIAVDLPDWKYEEGTPRDAKKVTSDDGVIIYVLRFDRELPAQ